MKKSLSVVVPTYNRAEFLDFFLEVHVPLLKKYDIALYICDNTSTDETGAITQKWQDHYDQLFYHCTDQTSNSDENAENALHLSETDYTWMVGDTYEISEQALLKVLDLIEQADDPYDVITLNLTNQITRYPEQVFTDKNRVMVHIGWMICCISCNVYHRKVIDQGRHGVYRHSNFAQFGFILDYIKDRAFQLYWLQSASVVTLKNPHARKGGWGHLFCDNMFYRLPKFIFSIPEEDYPVDTRVKALLELTHHSSLLQFRNTLLLRSQGALSHDVYDQYGHMIQLYAPLRFKIAARILCCLPKRVCKGASITIEWLRRRHYRLRKRFGLWPEHR